MEETQEQKSAFTLILLDIVNAFARRFIILIAAFLLLRTYEVIINGMQHGFANFTAGYIYGFLFDFLFLAGLFIPFFLLYSILYFAGKKVANIFFVIIATLICIVQAGLLQYFNITLVMLGSDLWSYSWADIKQTAGASGTVMISAVILLVFAVGVVSAFIFLPGFLRLKSNAAIAILVVIFFISLINPYRPLASTIVKGDEYQRNLVLNKSWFFFNGIKDHLFPTANELDIYSDNYIGDYEGNDEVARKQFTYIDEYEYPFLHTDETPDVLSAFFDSTTVKPNIVVILVEGLGRAFANEGAYLGNFTPFLDSLSSHSLYWENFLSQGGRTFAVLPSVFGSLPFGENGFGALGQNMPDHLSMFTLLQHNGYSNSFSYGGDASFDMMDVFLKKNKVADVTDIDNFPKGFTKLPGNAQGFTWGYGDKELYRLFLEKKAKMQQPYFATLLTIATHSPFFVNDQAKYDNLFDQRLKELTITPDKKNELRRYKPQLATVLYADDALRGFFNEYARHPDFANTIFLITGDHRMPEIPMSSKIDRYHVPFIMYSPMLNRSAKFSSVSTHFDIAPSLISFLKNRYHIAIPSSVSWIGAGLDTARSFRNIHSYPLMLSKSELTDFIMGDKMINGGNLFTIKKDMSLEPVEDKNTYNMLNGSFSRFKEKNSSIVQGKKMIPDSIARQFLR